MPISHFCQHHGKPTKKTGAKGPVQTASQHTLHKTVLSSAPFSKCFQTKLMAKDTAQNEKKTLSEQIPKYSTIFDWRGSNIRDYSTAPELSDDSPNLATTTKRIWGVRFFGVLKIRDSVFRFAEKVFGTRTYFFSVKLTTCHHLPYLHHLPHVRHVQCTVSLPGTSASHKKTLAITPVYGLKHPWQSRFFLFFWKSQKISILKN